MELMAERSFQAITVQDLTSRAMVNRSTFYDHFVDKYALLESALTEIFRGTLAAQLPGAERYATEHLEGLIVVMCDFFGHLHGHCKTADEQNVALFESQVMRLVKETLRGWLQESGVGDLDLAVAVASWAIYGAASHFTESKQAGSVAAFAAAVAPRIEASLGLNLVSR